MAITELEIVAAIRGAFPTGEVFETLAKRGVRFGPDGPPGKVVFVLMRERDELVVGEYEIEVSVWDGSNRLVDEVFPTSKLEEAFDRGRECLREHLGL